MLSKVKTALRIATTSFDGELQDLINGAVADLGIAGVINLTEDDTNDTVYKPVAIRAIITYCKMNFGSVDKDDYDRLKRSYDEQKAQLVTATGYTDWDEDDD